MFQHDEGIKNNPKNFYAATKQSFNMILEYFAKNNKNIKFLNLYIGDTYGNNDKRTKIIPQILKSIILTPTFLRIV